MNPAEAAVGHGSGGTNGSADARQGPLYRAFVPCRATTGGAYPLFATEMDLGPVDVRQATGPSAFGLGSTGRDGRRITLWVDDPLVVLVFWTCYVRSHEAAGVKSRRTIPPSHCVRGAG